MSDVLPCPSCDNEIAVGFFPVYEGTLAYCLPCNLTLCVAVVEDEKSPHGGWASLQEQTCDDCGQPSDSTCKRCCGSGNEPAILPDTYKMLE